jgi:hypothetical protein
MNTFKKNLFFNKLNPYLKFFYFEYKYLKKNMNLAKYWLYSIVITFIIPLFYQNCNTETDEYCSSCVDNICVNCDYSYRQDNKCIPPQVKIEHCISYQDEHVCHTCLNGYTLNNDFTKCVPINISGCLESLDEHLCLNCDGHLLDEWSFECLSSVECSIEGCRSCSNQHFEESCKICDDDYLLNFQSNSSVVTCVKRTPETEGCYGIFNDKCWLCRIGYKDVNTGSDEIKCVKTNTTSSHFIEKAFVHYSCHNGNDHFCTECGVKGCTKCQMTYPGDRGNCVITDKIIPGCISYEDAITCGECTEGFYLKDNSCIKTNLENCINPLDETKCEYCNKMEVTNQGVCDDQKVCDIPNCLSCHIESEQKCIKCEYGYTLDWTTNTCISFEENNQQHKGCEMMRDNLCFKCIPEFYISEYSVSTFKCSKTTQYTSIDGLFISESKKGCFYENDEYCLACLNNKCVSCLFSYLNSVGVCIPPKEPVENCLTYWKDDTCLKCMNHYYLSSDRKQCLPITIPNCLESDDNIDCFLCDGMNDFETGKCKNNEICSDPNCKSCSNLFYFDQCNICKDGYIRSFFGKYDFEDVYICKEKTAETESCQLVENSECKQCEFGYYYSGRDERGIKCTKSTLYNHVYIYEIIFSLTIILLI